ncbi:19580264-b5b3-416f-a156-66681de4619c [Thermothielavioides terrestris]|uniref:19580264-b5b3-416f-a156-66681de4619c n=1 Tax=Thermothielavioides terrestris TaxID=2587410 RepID=A0A3S4ETV3_9PEZI|nr:19580264-b5b3-416f-a156-66681de4619c [Thermothielavioides terrestris]
MATHLLSTLTDILNLPIPTTTITTTTTPSPPSVPPTPVPPSLRRGLPARHPRLAAQLARLDWRGVEAELPARSFARR